MVLGRWCRRMTHNKSCNQWLGLSVSLPAVLYSITPWSGGEIPPCDWCRSWGSLWCHRNNTTVFPPRDVVGRSFCLSFSFHKCAALSFFFFIPFGPTRSRYHSSRKRWGFYSPQIIMVPFWLLFMTHVETCMYSCYISLSERR